MPEKEKKIDAAHWIIDLRNPDNAANYGPQAWHIVRRRRKLKKAYDKRRCVGKTLQVIHTRCNEPQFMEQLHDDSLKQIGGIVALVTKEIFREDNPNYKKKNRPKRASKCVSEMMFIQSDSASPLEIASNNEVANVLQKYFANMVEGNPKWIVFEHLINGVSRSEIARRLVTTEYYVRSRYDRALEQLQHHLEKQGIDSL